MKNAEDLKGCLKRLCSARLTEEDAVYLQEKYGLIKKELTNQMLVAARLLERAKKDGDVSAVKQICAILDENDDRTAEDSLRVTVDFVSPPEASEVAE